MGPFYSKGVGMAERRHALLSWINAFPNLSCQAESLGDLSDGVQLGEILCQMIPDEINSKLIKKDFGDNSIIRANNLRRVISASQNFLSHSGIHFPVANRVDAQTIANDADEEQIEILLQAILGVAVECENKNDYITLIMNLSEDCQQHLMLLIESVMQSSSDSLPAPAQQAAQEELSLLSAENTELKQRVHDLIEQRRALSEQYAQLESDGQSDRTQRKALKDERDSLLKQVGELEVAIEKARKREEEAQRSLRALQTSLQNRESDSRAISTELQEELVQREETINKLRKRTQELEKENALTHELRQRVDVLMDAQAEAEQDKKRLLRLREKMNEFKEFKSRYNTMETKLNATMKENAELQWQVQQQKQSLSSLTTYKEDYNRASSQLVQLEVEVDSQTSRVKELETQLEQVERQASHLRESNQRLTEQNRTLQEQIEDHQEEHSHQMHDHMGLDLDEVLTPEMKERMQKLEIENETLTKALEASQQAASLQDELDRARSNESVLQTKLQAMESQLASARQESSQMSARLREQSEEQDKASQDSTEETQRELQALQARYQESLQSSQALQSEMAALKDHVSQQAQLTQENAELKEQLALVESELSQTQAALVEKNGTIQQLTQSTEQLQAQVADATQEDRAVDQSELVNTLQAQVNKLQEENKELVMTEQVASDELKSTRQQLEDLQSQWKQHKEESEASSTELIASLQADLEATQAQLATMREQTPVITSPVADPETIELRQQLEEVQQKMVSRTQELERTRSALETAEIENEHLAQALEAEEPKPIQPDVAGGDNVQLCEHLKMQVDMLNSSLAALGLRYGNGVAINSSNSIERLSLLARKRNASGITY